jgi:hypothetical protein
VHPALIARYGSSTVETLAPLRERYGDFEVWRSIDLARGPLLRRLLARYGLAAPLFRIDDPARFVDSLEDTAHPETFWAIFHGDGAATRS